MMQNYGEQGPHRSGGMQPGWLILWSGVGLGGVLLVLSIVIPWIMTGFVPRWSGFGSKTLWDWLQLLVVPSFLLLGGFVINRSAAERDRRRIEGQQRIAERNAVERDRSTALESYLDRLSRLILDAQVQGLLQAPEFQAVVRAQTAATLPRLDQPRQGQVLRFLSETRVIASGSVTLVLRGVDLSQTHLAGIGLSDADLTGAILAESVLDGAELRNALLLGVNFRRASLRNADLRGADLRGATLDNADLRGALVTQEQLARAASRRHMIMPDGTTEP